VRRAILVRAHIPLNFGNISLGPEQVMPLYKTMIAPLGINMLVLFQGLVQAIHRLFGLEMI
jgi:hypothetical protein